MIAENLHQVEQNIQDAMARRTRVPKDTPVKLVAVTKNHDVEAMREAIDAGATDIGENRIQEAKSKFDVLDRDARVAGELVDLVDELPNLRLRGLMCIAPNYDDVEKCRPLFHEMYEIFQQVKEIPFKTANISYLSMGMTHDYQIAVEEGANIVRVGTAIFGPRQY